MKPATVKKGTHARYPWLVEWNDGKRRRKHFTKKTEASSFARAVNRQREKLGHSSAPLTDAEWTAVRAARERGVDLLAAVIAAPTQRSDITVAEAVEARLGEVSGSATATVNETRTRLASFVRDFGERKLCELTGVEIGDWVRSLPIGAQSAKNQLRVMSALWRLAQRMDWVHANIIAEIPRPKVVRTAPGILTLDQLAELFAVASSEMFPALAIGAWCGLRQAEISRLRWDDVHLARGFIELSAGITKTSQRRLVDIPANLAEMLSNVPRVGEVMATKHPQRFAAELSYPWPNNALRHSAASYALALHQDAGKVAYQLGHRGVDMLYEHYREVVTRDAAEEWFSAVFVRA